MCNRIRVKKAEIGEGERNLTLWSAFWEEWADALASAFHTNERVQITFAYKLLFLQLRSNKHIYSVPKISAGLKNPVVFVIVIVEAFLIADRGSSDTSSTAVLSESNSNKSDQDVDGNGLLRARKLKPVKTIFLLIPLKIYRFFLIAVARRPVCHLLLTQSYLYVVVSPLRWALYRKLVHFQDIRFRLALFKFVH